MRVPGGLRGAWPLRGRETQWQRKPCHNGRRPIPAMIRGFRERSQDRAHHGRPRRVRCRLRCPYIGCAEDDRLRHPAHVRHVRRHHLGTDAYRALGFGHVAVRGLGHAAVPFPCEGESAGVPRIVVCVHCGVRGHRAQRGSAPSTLRLSGRGLRGASVLGGVGAVQGVRPAAHHAVLSAGGHGPHRHLHRAYSGKLGHCQLRDELAYRARGYHHYRH